MFNTMQRIAKYELDMKLCEVISKSKLKDMADVGQRKEWEQNGFKVMIDRTKGENIIIFLYDGETLFYYT